MMNIGLIGSTSFYNRYRPELLKQSNIVVFEACTLDDALFHTALFDQLLNQCQYLIFEEVKAEHATMMIACLKNGKSVFMETAYFTAAQMQEMHNISNEGNLRCVIFYSAAYYKFFKHLKPEISNPSFIEMIIDYPHEENKGHLSENLGVHMYETMQHLLHFFRSDIRQIQVKPCRIFSERTDLISIQLDFSNGCGVNIKMTDFTAQASELICVYQPGRIFTIQLEKDGPQKNEHSPHSETVDAREINITGSRRQHFLNVISGTETSNSSILDNYLALELSAKIVKKINSYSD